MIEIENLSFSMLSLFIVKKYFIPNLKLIISCLSFIRLATIVFYSFTSIWVSGYFNSFINNFTCSSSRLFKSSLAMSVPPLTLYRHSFLILSYLKKAKKDRWDAYTTKSVYHQFSTSQYNFIQCIIRFKDVVHQHFHRGFLKLSIEK